MDTWSILEARFHGIGDRDHNVVLQFYKKDAEHYGYALSGPVVEGEHRISVVIAAGDGSLPEPDFATGHYSTHDLWDMLSRSGRLMNREQHRTTDDGAERFVAALVYHFGNSLSHESNGQTFFSNGARACGMMAGKLASQEDRTKPPNPLSDVPKKRSSKPAKPFTDKQLEAVRSVLQEKKNPNMTRALIVSHLERSGRVPVGNDNLTLILDHIRDNFPGEYTVPTRQRKSKS